MDFVFRSGLSFAIAQAAKWRPLSESTVAVLTAALNDSPLSSVLQSLSLAGAAQGGMNPFHREGLNRSRMIRLACWTPRTAGRKVGRGQSMRQCALRCPAGTGDRPRIYRSRRTLWCGSARSQRSHSNSRGTARSHRSPLAGAVSAARRPDRYHACDAGQRERRRTAGGSRGVSISWRFLSHGLCMW